ncbi:MAG TPA: carboxypeptidase regulatory-like domain-containing protein [Leptolyngbyaceae cyanobacterium]
MIYQTPPTLQAPVTHLIANNIPTKASENPSTKAKYETVKDAIATPSVPESLPAEFSANTSQPLSPTPETNQTVVAQSTSANTPTPVSNTNSQLIDSIKTPPQSQPAQPQIDKEGINKTVNVTDTNNSARVKFTEADSSDVENLLLGIIINRREVGSLDIVRQGKTLLLPLEEFAKLAKFSVETVNDIKQLNTPLGVVKLAENELQTIKGVVYISDTLLQEKLSSTVELNSLDLTLIVNLPWGERANSSSSQASQLQPEFLPPLNGLSNFRQELNITSNSGDVGLQSYTLLGGRLAGGLWRVRFNNNFENSPNLTEYFYYRRSGQFRFQVGRQQIGLHPLSTGLNLTGLQIGYTNLPTDRFGRNNNANELLPRRSRSVQTFQGVAPAASFVQLRVAGVVVAQQQVGFDGRYEFVDVNLPVGQNNQIEVLIYDRNNFRTPIEIRTVRINASDLLLPAGGNVQLAGLGLSGNLAQNSFFEESNSTEAGKFIGFYQFRQGLSNNLTFEGTLQAIPNTFQSQAGLIWRVANPVIVSASVGNSFGKFAYNADLDIQLGRLEFNANSQSVPAGYRNGRESNEFYNHSAELSYRLSNNFRLGVLARSRQSDTKSAEYIWPTFSLRPFSGLSLNGRPDIEGKYLFNAFYQMSRSTRLSFNSYGDRYSTDLSYNLSPRYQLSLGNDFGGNSATRYTASLNYNAPSLSQLSWRVGLAYSDGQVAPVVGASMRIIPGLFARVEYQGIPGGNNRSNFGGFGDDRLLISLVSDLSFAGGRVAPSNSSNVGKERGAISGRLTVEGGNKGFDLAGANISVYNNRNKTVGGARTDSQGNFFIGNLPEGVYMVEIDPEQLPVELSIRKTTTVAEVAMAAITDLKFSARLEYGLAGRITDSTGKPMPEVQVELINSAGARVSSAVTDQFGLYRLDGVPIGNYTLQVPPQNAIKDGVNMPTRTVTINSQFIYDQNLQLPVAAAVKETNK